MKKRILSLLLALVMLVGMIPATSLVAFAAAGGEVYVGGVAMSDGDYLAVGATATQTTKPSGGYAYYKDGVLTLNNFATNKLVRYYERYLEVELIGENEIGSISDYYYWEGNSSNDYYTGLEFHGSGDLKIKEYCKPSVEISVNGDVFFNGSGNIIIMDEIYCFQYTENVIINDGYVYCYSSQSGVFADPTNITVNGGKLQMVDGGGWWQFICDGSIVTAGKVYVYNGNKSVQPEDCEPWDGKTALKNYDTVWILPDSTNIGGTNVSVKCIGSINYTVSGQTVTVNHSLACKVGYISGGSYVAIAATKNGDGTYSFTAPAGVTDVVLVVKGDVSGDGRINVGDTAKLYSHVRGTAKLTDPIAIFAADVSGDGKLNVGDTAKVYSHVKATALLTW